MDRDPGCIVGFSVRTIGTEHGTVFDQVNIEQLEDEAAATGA